LEIQRLARVDLSCTSPGIAPNSQSFGAIVVQENPVAGGSGSASIGRYLTVREVAARLRLSTASVYRLCESGGLGHVRVSNAIRVAESDLGTFIRNQGRSPRR
jgi:excisionase family DNA binding protein